MKKTRGNIALALLIFATLLWGCVASSGNPVTQQIKPTLGQELSDL